MEPVSMNDGLDVRETVAFGLAASEVGVFLLTVLSAYAVLRSGLATAVAWGLAVALAGAGAGLAWGRLGGRPLLEWAVLLVRFAVRNAQAAGLPARARHGARRIGAAAGGARTWATARVLRAGARPAAAAIQVSLRRHGDGRAPLAAGATPRLAVLASGQDGPEPAPAHAQVAATDAIPVAGFFSLRGGTGRTTLAVEVAAVLAARGAAAEATGGRGLRIALLDMTERSPAVALRLGIPLTPSPAGAAAVPPDPGDSLVTLDNGLLVFPGPPPRLPSAAATVAWAEAVISAAARAGADLAVVDIDCDLGDLSMEMLRRCGEILVTATATAGGVLDAYRSTATLRRLGLRDRLGHVVNRARPEVDLGEAMVDLGATVVAEIPEDSALVRAESLHRVAALDGDGPVANAVTALAVHIEDLVRRAEPASARPRWGSHAG